MKKTIVLLLALAFCAAMLGAEEAAAAYKVTGDAAVTWGIDFTDGENLYHGFKNVANFKITFPIASGAKVSKGGEGIYGEIVIKDINFSLLDKLGDHHGAFSDENSDGDSASVTAKVIIYDAFVQIYAAPSFKYKNAVFETLFNTDPDGNGYTDAAAYGGKNTNSLVEPKTTIAGGVTLGYNFPKAFGNITLKAASKGDWGTTDATPDVIKFEIRATGATPKVVGPNETNKFYSVVGGVLTAYLPGAIIPANTLYYERVTTTGKPASKNDQYVLGLDLKLTPLGEVLTINGGFFYDFQTKYLGATAKVAAKYIGISAYAAMDLANSIRGDGMDDDIVTMDASFGLGYSFLEDKTSVNLGMYFVPENYGYANNLFNMGLSFIEEEEGGLLDALSFKLGLYFYDLAKGPANDPMLISLGLEAAYKVKFADPYYVKPYVKVYYDLNDGDPATQGKVYLNVGVEAKAIANTTFTLEYKGGTVGYNNNIGLVDKTLLDSQVITFKTKISL